jgi:hypothetical protein
MDEPVADLDDEPTVPCKRCGAPIALKSFRLPHARCDKCRSAEQPTPSEAPGMDERPTKRRGPLLWLAGRSWRFWVVVTLMLPVLYIASFGPAVWITSRLHSSPGGRRTPYRAMVIYYPLATFIRQHHKSPWGRPLVKWIYLGAARFPDKTGIIILPLDASGTKMLIWGVGTKNPAVQ